MCTYSVQFSALVEGVESIAFSVDASGGILVFIVYGGLVSVTLIIYCLCTLNAKTRYS